MIEQAETPLNQLVLDLDDPSKWSEIGGPVFAFTPLRANPEDLDLKFRSPDLLNLTSFPTEGVLPCHLLLSKLRIEAWHFLLRVPALIAVFPNLKIIRLTHWRRLYHSGT